MKKREIKLSMVYFFCFIVSVIGTIFDYIDPKTNVSPILLAMIFTAFLIYLTGDKIEEKRD